MAYLEKQLAEQRLKTAGYVVYPGGPLCGNGQYVEKGGFCNHPAVQAHVDEVNGCCNLWEPREKHGPREDNGRDNEQSE